MAEIPRRSKFTLTNEEIDGLRKQNEQTLKEYIEKAKSRGVERTTKQAYENLLIDLYYDIGMQDYWVYRDVKRNLPKQLLNERIKKTLEKRALDSARLQVLIDDMNSNEFDIDTILDPRIGDIFAYRLPNSVSPDIIYHGTSEELEPNEIGSCDENGFYNIRDGISYWSTEYDVAERYSRHLNPEQKAKGLVGGNVYSRGIENGTLCTTIAETHGGAFAMWQDELIRLNQMGVKYVFSAKTDRTDVLDISNFADFVQKRDECLLKTMEQYHVRLPEITDSLSSYLATMGLLEHDVNMHVQEQRTINEQNNKETRLAKLSREQKILIQTLEARKKEYAQMNIPEQGREHNA